MLALFRTRSLARLTTVSSTARTARLALSFTTCRPTSLQAIPAPNLIASSSPKPPLWWRRGAVIVPVTAAVVVVTAVASVDFVPKVTKVALVAERSAVALGVAIRLLVEYKRGLDQRPGETTEEYLRRKSELHLRAAKHLLAGLRTNGGIYIKLGQHLAALVYLLPTEYTETLKVLQNEAPRSSFESVERVIREEWGGRVEDYFQEFDREPLGSASLAQVHRARLRGSGREVAVKIQHHGLDRFAQGDLITVEATVKAIKFFFPEFNFDWLAAELKASLPLEMDFVIEGKNANRASRQFERARASGVGGLLGLLIDGYTPPPVVIPEVIWPLTSRRILTMEFSPGNKISDVDYLRRCGISVDHVAAAVSQVFAQMIFVTGFVHADPHAGNILVRPKLGGRRGDFEVVLLDHGLYREVEREVRLNYAHLWEAIISGDEAAISRYSEALGVGHLYQLFSVMLTSRLWNTIAGGDVGSSIDLAELSSLQSKVSDYAVEIADVLSKVPRSVLLLMKTNDLLKCIEGTLRPSAAFNSYSIMASYLVRAINEDLAQNDLSLTERLACSLKLLQVGAKIKLLDWTLWLHSRFNVSPQL